jgi:CMP-N-acetylneuraminic acid synthetase/quercetin dioxygenase-like cupin family protein
MKTIAMIPVRMGSTRVPKKNIRMLAGKPLVAWIIEAAIQAGCFDEIYLNSEDELFREIAAQYGISFYKRPPEMASDGITNDDFMYDFLKNVQCDYVVQLLATSPFIKPETIRVFTEKTIQDGVCAVVSVKNVQIECLYKNQPVNFDSQKSTRPSQELTPVQAYACGLMGWKSDTYQYCYENILGAYHGRHGNHCKYFELTGYEIVDIDNEEDFLLAEAVAAAIAVKEKPEPQYYQFLAGKKVETDVDSILKNDEIGNNMLNAENHVISIIPNLVKLMGEAPWSKRIINTPQGAVTLICQNPGKGNREHYHPDIDEWWYIYQGKYIFRVEGEDMLAVKGDMVFVKRGQRHLITATGEETAIRIAFSIDGAKHVYTN